MKPFFLYLIVFSGIFISRVSFATESASPPPQKGYFSLPASQQSGTFISLGQGILNKGQSQAAFFADDTIGTYQHYVDVYGSLLYGLSDSVSIQLYVPFAADYKQNGLHSSGLENINLQLAYGYYSDTTQNYSESGTLVLNTYIPTSSSHKNPSTGIDATSFLLGTTFSRTYVNWFLFVSPGIILNIPNSNTHYGNKYLYQGGFGHVIADSPSKWILSWLMELDGQYANKDKLNGIPNPNSGGNVIYVTPSLAYSNQNIILQFGPSFAFAQHLFGQQNNNHYAYSMKITWTL